MAERKESLTKMTEDGIRKTTQIESKYVYRWGCASILVFLATLLFFLYWYPFVAGHNNTGSLLGKGNLTMAAGIYAALYLVIGRGTGAFQIGVDRISNVMAAQAMTLFTVDFLEIFISMAITGQFRYFPAFLRLYLLMFLAQTVLICVLVYPMIVLYRKWFPPLRVLEIYGDNRNFLAKKVGGRQDKYQVCGHIYCGDGIEKLTREAQKYEAVLINDLPSPIKNKILKVCFDLDKRVYFTPKISDIVVKSAQPLNLFDTPLFLCRNRGISLKQSVVKRLFDVVCSSLALVLLLPVFVLVALAIKGEDHGPVFFKQERCTEGGKVFRILKFRSMIVDAEKDGRPHPAGGHDDRITKVGAFIRRTRIDELPQLINILKGEMSIVGPRPERVEHVQLYTEEIPEFHMRLKMKGGLTGYAQVYGKYNTDALDKLKLDLYYILNYSFLLDLQIIFETVKILCHRESTEGFSEEQVRAMQDGNTKEKP